MHKFKDFKSNSILVFLHTVCYNGNASDDFFAKEITVMAKRFGVMLDMSRNAVMKPEEVKKLAP